MEIYRVEIPQHIRKIKLSEKQRARYFEWNGVSIKGKSKVPIEFFRQGNIRTQTVLIEELKNEYCICQLKNNQVVDTITSTSMLPNIKELFNNNFKWRLGVVTDKWTDFPLSNTNQVGKPKMYLIKGQDIYSGNLREHTRGIVMDEIKNCYKPHLLNLPVIDDYPIKITCEIHDTIDNYYDRTRQKWDIDNYAYPYLKAFPDLMQELRKIRNDDRMHLTQPPSAIFCPIEDHNNRKLVFIISKDERDIIKNNKIYQEFHIRSKNSYESEDTQLIKDEEPFKDEE